MTSCEERSPISRSNASSVVAKGPRLPAANVHPSCPERTRAVELSSFAKDRDSDREAILDRVDDKSG